MNTGSLQKSLRRYKGSIPLPQTISHKPYTMCLTSHAISQLLELLSTWEILKDPDTLGNYKDTPRCCWTFHRYNNEASFTIMFQTDLYLPSAIDISRILFIETRQYKSPSYAHRHAEKAKRAEFHWLMDIYKMFISVFFPEPKFPFSMSRLSCCQTAWRSERMALISVCLFIYICALAIHLWRSTERGLCWR